MRPLSSIWECFKYATGKLQKKATPLAAFVFNRFLPITTSERWLSKEIDSWNFIILNSVLLESLNSFKCKHFTDISYNIKQTYRNLVPLQFVLLSKRNFQAMLKVSLAVKQSSPMADPFQFGIE